MCCVFRCCRHTRRPTLNRDKFLENVKTTLHRPVVLLRRECRRLLSCDRLLPQTKRECMPSSIQQPPTRTASTGGHTGVDTRLRAPLVYFQNPYFSFAPPTTKLAIRNPPSPTGIHSTKRPKPPAVVTSPPPPPVLRCENSGLPSPPLPPPEIPGGRAEPVSGAARRSAVAAGFPSPPPKPREDSTVGRW